MPGTTMCLVTRTAGGARELELDGGAIHGVQRERDRARIGVVDRDAVVVGVREHPVELTPARDGLVGTYVDALADRAREVLRAHQRTVETGGRAFEMVTARDGVVCVEHVTELARDPGQFLERHAAGGAWHHPVEPQPPNPPTSLLRGDTARRRARAPPLGRGARTAPRRAG